MRLRPGLEALEGRSVPAFIAPVDSMVAGRPIGMKSGDFNGDGIPDLATANSNRSVSVLRSNGDGTFQPARNTPTTYYPYAFGENALAAGDFDRDGKLDLATSANDPAGIGVNVLLGRGDSTFANAAQPAVGISWTTSIATGDINGDGKLDLVAAAADDFIGTTYVDLLWGNVDLIFSCYYNMVYGPAEVFSLALADFDRDNKLDLVLGGSTTTWVLLGNGDGRFQDPRDLGPLAGSLTVTDFNSDGKPDLASTWGDVSVLLGDGDGSFQAARSFTAGGASVTAADVNGDYAPDLVLGLIFGGGSVLLATTAGDFGPPITTAASGYHLVVADFNGDGRPDEAMTRSNSAPVTVLFNDGIWDGSPPPPLPPTLRIGDVSDTEGHAGTRAATFIVTLSAPSAQAVTVQYANVTATAGGDYQARSGTLTIPAGQTTGTITVPVLGDRLPEADETFFVNLSGATDATIANGQAVGTIVDDEPSISISDFTKAECKKNRTTLFTFTVTLSVPYDQPVTMSFSTLNGTATTGDNDYVAKAGTLTFAPGETTKAITVEVKGDSRRESNEYLYLDLSGNSSNSLFAKRRGLGTILNDD